MKWWKVIVVWVDVWLCVEICYEVICKVWGWKEDADLWSCRQAFASLLVLKQVKWSIRMRWNALSDYGYLRWLFKFAYLRWVRLDWVEAPGRHSGWRLGQVEVLDEEVYAHGEGRRARTGWGLGSGWSRGTRTRGFEFELDANNVLRWSQEYNEAVEWFWIQVDILLDLTQYQLIGHNFIIYFHAFWLNHILSKS